MMQTMSVLINIVLAITIIQNADCNGPYLQNCETDLQCPDGYACLRPGYGEASAKAQMKCYPCCCREKTQCYIKSKLSGINCDCGDSGYTGACCETDINDCYNNSCLNDGTCIDGVNNYTCICPEGFSGRNCETDINDCYNNSCLNDGTCIDGVNNYTCICPEGFSGRNCETDINDCYNNSCLNDGTCIDGVNNYTCICPEGFSGRNCETALKPPTCMANNNCFKTASECGTGCYIEEQDQDEVISNTWSASFALIIFPYATVERCRNRCLTFNTCVAYAFNPTGRSCYLYTTTPAEGLVTEYSNTDDLYVLRCSSC
ncbi:fibropellin-3-like [Ruditapes philippinarum]|uniref:fibropellin-3-like n=1 Tax=Ruditapes philippinarum TaxID=129788 RepID=UPI00295C274A|nr:fibropellin-3-like [Ruditapes philippinarum]